MEKVATIMTKLINQFLYVVEIPCPECGGQMHAWKEKAGEEPRAAPVCMDCGYKALRKNDAKETQELYADSLKAKSINYLKYQSVLPNKALLKNTIENFTVTDRDTQQAKETAVTVVEKVLNDESVHAVFTGKTGVGKSHISMGILWAVIEQSGYNKKCLFINYSELLEQMKFAMNDKEVHKAVMGTLMAEIKVADVVVLDDLGAEAGLLSQTNAKVSDFNIRTLTSILDARANQSTIVTTNLTGKQIREMYGSRVVSRILSNAEGLTVKMHDTSDKRMVTV